MNWIHFFLWVTGLYSCYYAAILVTDWLRAQRQSPMQTEREQLVFSESVEPQRMIASGNQDDLPQIAVIDEMPDPQKPEVIGSGGVPITDLFRLAKQEAIIYTRSVSF